MGEEYISKSLFDAQCKTTNEALVRIEGVVNETHKRLFVGNGQPPLTVQVDRHERLLGAAIWVVSAVVIAVVGIIVERVMK